MKTKIKTIDVNCKEWFDNQNGNSYFAGTVTVNFGLKDAKIFNIPFQYGYGDQYRYEAFKTLQNNINKKSLKEYSGVYWHYYQDNNIIVRHSLQKNCLKREVLNTQI